MMNSLTTTTPSSPQLRLALRSGNHHRCWRRSHHHLLFVRKQQDDNNHHHRLMCVIAPRNRSPVLNASASDAAGSDGLAGWSGDDENETEKDIELERKGWFGGVVGAGVAGMILVGGLTFAAFALSNRKASGPKQQMEPLTAEQEISLLTVDETPSDEVRMDGNGKNDVKFEGRHTEGNKDIDLGPFSSSKYDESTDESKIVTDVENPSSGDIKYTSSGTDTSEDISSQEKDNTALVDVQATSETTPSEKMLSEPEIRISSSAAPNLTDPGSTGSGKPYTEIQDSPLSVEPIDLSNPGNLDADSQEQLPGANSKDGSDTNAKFTTEHVAVSILVSSELDAASSPPVVPSNKMETIVSPLIEENPDMNKTQEASAERNISSSEVDQVNDTKSPGTYAPSSPYPAANELESNGYSDVSKSRRLFEIPTLGRSGPAGIPAPSIAIQVNPGKVIVPAAVDQVQGQALAALQVLKVIETDAQPSDLCTRREYARWLVSASSALSRNTASKVYPAMYIENVTELAFDDVTPQDPDFPSVQGLAEAGLITSKLSSRDLLIDSQGPFLFSPESLLSRQDLVSWKMALEKQQLPEADKKMLYELSGFIDIDKINPDAWPALIADLSAAEQGITALAFGCTRLFQPDKPVTKAQAAIALASGEASEIVSEELARIEAESIAENAVSVHNALVAQVEKDVNANFENELSMEREKIDAVAKMAEQAKLELEQLRTRREEENLALLKERATIESEMEVLSRLRREAEEQLQSLMSDKAEISYEKERLKKLRIDAEDENQRISKLQYELEVERKALSMARAWAEDEAKRAQEQAKALEESRRRWEMSGLKVVVDEDLREESTPAVTWLNTGKEFSVEGTVKRAETLVDKLKVLANDVKGKSREVIDIIIQKILLLVSTLKEWACKAGRKAEELKEAATAKSKGCVEGMQQGAAQLSSAMKDGVKRVADDCREGVGKLTQKFKT